MQFTRKRMWLGLVCLMVVLGSGSSIVFLGTGPNHLSKANFDKLERGMTVREVESTLGGTPGITFPSSRIPAPIEFVEYKGQEVGRRTFIRITFVDGVLSAKRYEQESFSGFVRRHVAYLGL
jgi:hypothetical protein